MKLEVWTESKPQKEGSTPIRLFDNGEGNVNICVVDAKGGIIGSGVLAAIKNEGLHRLLGLSAEHGFPLDEGGRILDI